MNAVKADEVDKQLDCKGSECRTRTRDCPGVSGGGIKQSF